MRVQRADPVTYQLPPRGLRARLRDAIVSCVCAAGAAAAAATSVLRRQPRASSPKKILLIRRGGLGDALMMTPLIRSLKNASPDCEICVLVGAQAKAVFERNPAVRRIFEAPANVSGWLGLLKEVSSERFDVAIILHRFFAASLLPLAAGIPQRIGFQWKRHGFALTAGLPYEPTESQVRQIGRLASLVGAAAPDPASILPVPQTALERARALLRAWGLDPGKPIVGVHPGGGDTAGSSHPTKRWPPDRFAALADRLANETETQVLVLQGPGDEPYVAAMSRWMSTRPKAVVAGVSLWEFAAVLSCCDLVVANDSGPMHLAAGVATPVLAIFGPTHPTHLCPPGERNGFVWAGVSCSPCHNPDELAAAKSWQGRKTFECWRGSHECMLAVSVDSVYAAAKSRLRSRPVADSSRFVSQLEAAGRAN